MTEPATAPAIRCPLPRCGVENPAEADGCAGCGAPLRGFARLASYPPYLFNQGLAAARDGRLAEAGGYFAAVVHWCPADIEARNALALAELALGHTGEARRHWESVLERRPGDALARSGLSRTSEVPR